MIIVTYGMSNPCDCCGMKAQEREWLRTAISIHGTTLYLCGICMKRFNILTAMVAVDRTIDAGTIFPRV